MVGSSFREGESAGQRARERERQRMAHLGHLVKHKELVVVAAARELVVITPLETTNFLPVHRELVNPVILDPDVTVVNQAVVRSRRQDVIIPRERADFRYRHGGGGIVRKKTLPVDQRAKNAPHLVQCDRSFSEYSDRLGRPKSAPSRSWSQ